MRPRECLRAGPAGLLPDIFPPKAIQALPICFRNCSRRLAVSHMRFCVSSFLSLVELADQFQYHVALELPVAIFSCVNTKRRRDATPRLQTLILLELPLASARVGTLRVNLDFWCSCSYWGGWCSGNVVFFVLNSRCLDAPASVSLMKA